MENEPCDLLIDAVRRKNAITQCPYCERLFDLHVGMMFVEGKQTSDPTKWGKHEYFEQVMRISS